MSKKIPPTILRQKGQNAQQADVPAPMFISEAQQFQHPPSNTDAELVEAILQLMTLLNSRKRVADSFSEEKRSEAQTHLRVSMEKSGNEGIEKWN